MTNRSVEKDNRFIAGAALVFLGFGAAHLLDVITWVEWERLEPLNSFSGAAFLVLTFLYGVCLLEWRRRSRRHVRHVEVRSYLTETMMGDTAVGTPTRSDVEVYLSRPLFDRHCEVQSHFAHAVEMGLRYYLATGSTKALAEAGETRDFDFWKRWSVLFPAFDKGGRSGTASVLEAYREVVEVRGHGVPKGDLRWLRKAAPELWFGLIAMEKRFDVPLDGVPALLEWRRVHRPKIGVVDVVDAVTASYGTTTSP